VCILNNVCWHMSEKKFFFHSPTAPILSMGRYEHDERLASMVPRFWMREWAIGEEPFKMYHSTKHFPEGALWLSSDRHRFLFQPLFPRNWGHALLDNIFPGFRALRLFGISNEEISKTEYVQYSSCKDIFSNRVNVQECLLMLKKVAIFATDESLLELGRLGKGKNVCFPSLVVGSGKGSFIESDGLMLKEWTEYTRNRFGANFSPPDAERGICVMVKDGRRALLNYDVVLKSLNDAFPDKKIIPLRKFPKLSSADQIMHMDRCDVLITPGGGISLIANYLRLGSTVIIVNFFDVIKNQTGIMDGGFFENLPWLNVLHYPLSKYEVTIECNKSDPIDLPKNPPLWVQFRNCGSVTITPLKLIALVNSVFESSGSPHVGRDGTLSTP
jgi:hypothetical protein